MSTNARPNRVKMAVAALTILTATAARVLQDLLEITARLVCNQILPTFRSL